MLTNHPQVLLNDVKNYLGVTWDDERLLKQIADGIKVIENYTNTEINFTENPVAYELLKSYVRYDRNHATEFFEEKFQSRLLNLQYQEALKQEATYGV